MADAKDGFRWLREFDYNVEWFAEHGPKIRAHLGHPGITAGPARNILEGAHEHAMELAVAIKKLKEIADNG